jgi:hypothetical protein
MAQTRSSLSTFCFFRVGRSFERLVGLRQTKQTSPSKEGRGATRPEEPMKRRRKETQRVEVGAVASVVAAKEDEQQGQAKSNHSPYFLLFCCVGLFSFLVYYGTLYPTVAGGDSGELVVSAFQLGITHPPGYPLWTLLGHLFSLLPFKSVAWRLNLSSALYQALANTFLSLSIHK